VPDGFKKWVNENKERIEKAEERDSLPYFLRDNLDFVNKSYSYKYDVDNLRNRGYIIDDITAFRYNSIMGGFNMDELDNDITGALQKIGINIQKKKLLDYGSHIELNYTGTEGFRLVRRFQNGSVSHEYFKIDENYQGKGLSKDIFRSLYKQYKKADIKKITVHANIDAGGYVWTKYGFTAEKDEYNFLIRFAQECEKNNNITHSQCDDFISWISKYEGVDIPLYEYSYSRKEWAKELFSGSNWKGYLNLSNMQTRKIFEDYLKK
jgi:GNAT superfamily N-acetyltransferase